MDSLTTWAEFGLIGAVVGALFLAIIGIVRMGLAEFRNLHQLHREERGEWRAESGDRQTETNTVIRELTDVIKSSQQR